MFLTFNCIHEEKPNEKWKHLFESTWNNYKKWFLSQGYQARTGYVTSVSKLEEYMPELLPIYHQIVALAGGGRPCYTFFEFL